MSNRRTFLRQAGLAAMATGISPLAQSLTMKPGSTHQPIQFEISLAEFSLASDLMSGKLSNLDFPQKAATEFGIRVVEYVSGFFNNKHKDKAYLADLLKRCKDLGVTNHLIMVDDQNLAARDAGSGKKRWNRIMPG